MEDLLMTRDRSGRVSRLFAWGGWPWFAWIALLLLLAGSRPCLAQAPIRTATKFYPDFSDTADALLRNAASHARDGQWAEAVDIYQRVIQQFGDKVAKLPKDDPTGDPTGESVLFVDLRQFCQRRLAALPPEARALYRARVDGQAERLVSPGGRRPRPGPAAADRRPGVLQLVGRRCARPARRPGVPGRAV